MPTVRDLRYHRASNNNGHRFDLVNSSVYARNHLQIILRVVFCLDPGPRFQQLKQLLSSLLRTLLLPCTPAFFFPPLQQDLGA